MYCIGCNIWRFTSGGGLAAVDVVAGTGAGTTVFRDGKAGFGAAVTVLGWTSTMHIPLSMQKRGGYLA